MKTVMKQGPDEYRENQTMGCSNILWRMMNPLNPGSKMYIARRKGDGGVDWEYTNDPARAMRASEYWRRRFFADCKRCGDKDFNYGAF